MADPRVMGGGEGVESGDARAVRREAFGFALAQSESLPRLGPCAECSRGCGCGRAGLRPPAGRTLGIGEEIARCRTPKGSG